MTGATRSFEKVFYTVRPAKQIERRMLMDAFVRLMTAGLPLRDAQYLGMGSVDFVDFVLFHKYLGLQRMHSVEYEGSIERRIKFNKPFGGITHSIESAGDFIARADRDRPHIAWLDYDDRIKTEMLDDVTLAAGRFAAGSIILGTVDIEPFIPGRKGMAELKRRYETECKELLPQGLRTADFAPERIGRTTGIVLGNAITRGLSARPSLNFEPLFSFEYADGHRMITIGGLLAGDHERRALASADLSVPFIRRDLRSDPYRIQVPRLTRRERAFLDQHLPGRPGWIQKAFEITREEVDQYRQIYQYFPQYGEVII